MRWIVRGLLVLVGLIVVAAGLVYGGSEWKIRTTHKVALPQIAADRTPAGIAEGGRLASALGCRSCHGPQGNGRLMVDVPNVVHLVTPAFAPVIAHYSDPELARLIRHGVRRDGTGVYIMPIDGHAQIADEDLARIIGWMRTLKPSAADTKDRLRFGPVGRFLLLTGAITPEVRETVVGPAKRPADTGKYIVDAVCGGCHSLHSARKAHDDGRNVPPLVEAGPAYDIEQFRTLLRTGKGLSPRDLGLMAVVAKDDLSHLSDAEVLAVHDYLKAEAAKAPPK